MLLGLFSLIVILVGMLAVVALALLAMESCFNASVTHPYPGPIIGLGFMLAVTFGGSDLFALLPFLNSPMADPSTSWVEQGSRAGLGGRHRHRGNREGPPRRTAGLARLAPLAGLPG